MSSSNNNSTASNDPRQPSAARSYVASPIYSQDLPVDYAGFIAIILSIAGMRYTPCSWLALIFCARSLVNMRNFEKEIRQISMALGFAVMGLIRSYSGTARPGMQS